MPTRFRDLTDRQILALAITQEEEDSRIYADVADGLQAEYPASARLFQEMQGEEVEHRRRLSELYRQRFGEHIPHIRRQDVRGFVTRRPVGMVRPLGIDAVRALAATMEIETRRFYERAAEQTRDVLGSQPLHGHPVPVRRVPGDRRWNTGVRGRHPDRQLVGAGGLGGPGAEGM